jgi:hypothetical protein
LTRFRPPNRPPSDRPCCPLAVSLAGFSRFNFVTVANLELEKQINFGLSTWSRHGGGRGSPRKDPIPPLGGWGAHLPWSALDGGKCFGRFDDETKNPEPSLIGSSSIRGSC